MRISAPGPLRAWCWKEARESFPKILGVLVAYVLLAAVLMVIPTGDLERAQVGLWILTLVIPGIIAVSVLSAERWHRTDLFVNALPIRRSHIYLLKWTWGLLSLLLPLAVAALIVTACTPLTAFTRYTLAPGPWFFELLGTAAILYAWCMAASGRITNSFAPVGLVLFLNAVALAWTSQEQQFLHTPATGITTWLPSSIFTAAFGSHAEQLTIAWRQAIVLTLLLAIATFNASRRPIARFAPSAAIATTQPTRRLRPWRSPLFRMAWRETRLPILLLAAVVVATLAWSLVSMEIGKTIHAHAYMKSAYLSPSEPLAIAALLTLALAIPLGARFGATQAATPTVFWNTRPIAAGGLFWHHAATELTALLLVMLLPIAAVQVFCQHLLSSMDPTYEHAIDGYLYRGLAAAVDLARIFLVEIPFAYAVALMLGALTRSQLLATTLTIALAIAWASLESYLWTESRLLPSLQTTNGALLHAASVLTLTCIAFALARLFFQLPPLLQRSPAQGAA